MRPVPEVLTPVVVGDSVKGALRGRPPLHADPFEDESHIGLEDLRRLRRFALCQDRIDANTGAILRLAHRRLFYIEPLSGQRPGHNPVVDEDHGVAGVEEDSLQRHRSPPSESRENDRALIPSHCSSVKVYTPRLGLLSGTLRLTLRGRGGYADGNGMWR